MANFPPSTPPAKSEWVFALVVAVLTAVLLYLPYGLGYASQTPQTQFTGLVMNPEDSQTYLAKMWQGYNGRFLYTIPFTPEPHAGAFVGVFYLVLGHLARLLGVSNLVMWHLSRGVANLFMFLVAYGFIAHFLADRQMRRTAYVLALFGSGLGWLLFVLNQPYWLGAFPVDFKEPEAHLFFTALTFPHVAFGTTMTAVSVYALAQLPASSTRFPLLLANMANLLIGLAYPFLLYLVFTITALYWLQQTLQARRPLWRLGINMAATFLLPAPLYGYYIYVVSLNPVFQAWDVQAATPSYPWPHYLVAYGPMLLLGVVWAWKRPFSRPNTTLLWVWVVAVALLLYAPINAQRRFVQGVQLPLAILATAAFCDLCLPWLHTTRPWQWLIRRPRYTTPGLNRLVTLLFLLWMSLSNLYLLADVTRTAVLVQPDPLYRPLDEIETSQWVETNTLATAVILGDYQTGNYVAAHAGRQVMVGHWAETMNYQEKLTAVATFFAADTPHTWRRDLLRQFHITHVWFGPREQTLGEFDPQTADYLRPVYSQRSITLYEVWDEP